MNVISLDHRRNIARALDCQGESPVIGHLQRTKAGLAKGYTAAEIRDLEARQCEALIENAARALQHLRTPQQAAMFVSRLGIRMNNEAQS